MYDSLLNFGTFPLTFQIIAASPYSGVQYKYDDVQPTKHYQDFARRAGCHDDGDAVDSTVFDCLVGTDTMTLQHASGNVSSSGSWGTWAFLPVTDGDFLRELPSKQLLDRKVSGRRILSAVSRIWSSFLDK